MVQVRILAAERIASSAVPRSVRQHPLSREPLAPEGACAWGAHGRTTIDSVQFRRCRCAPEFRTVDEPARTREVPSQEG